MKGKVKSILTEVISVWQGREGCGGLLSVKKIRLKQLLVSKQKLRSHEKSTQNMQCR